MSFVEIMGNRTVIHAAVAIQLSGHLHHETRWLVAKAHEFHISESHIHSAKDLPCYYTPALRHVLACRQRFWRCDVYVHTWFNATSTTPAGSGTHSNPLRQQLNSTACLQRLRLQMQPRGVMVETQPLAPDKHARAPDGKPLRVASRG